MAKAGFSSYWTETVVGWLNNESGARKVTCPIS